MNQISAFAAILLNQATMGYAQMKKCWAKPMGCHQD
jgi:hypothetical protein